MEGTEKPHTDKSQETMNDWKNDASCMLTSLPVLLLENLMHLIYVAQSVYILHEG